jgi:hypothetical protein
VATALALVYPQATARGLGVGNRCVSGADSAYMGDPHRVEQVLINLLSNAVKFTPPGGRLEVECGVTDAPSADARLAEGAEGPGGSPLCWCYVRVADTGPGVAPEMRGAIFDPFVQAEPPAHGAGGNGAGGNGTLDSAPDAAAAASGASPNPYTRTHGGTGLGLAISRRLARLMGGDVTLDAGGGPGATFTLWLPAPPAVRAAATGEPAGCTTDERRTGLRHVAGLGRAGAVLRNGGPAVVAAVSRRLRAELAAPSAATLPAAELEGHLGTLLAEVARALVLIEEAGGETTRTLRDGTEMQRVLAERHGAQRAALGWSEADHRREFAILNAEVEGALRSALGAAPVVDAPDATDAGLAGAIEVVARLLGHVERAGERARRTALV